MSSKSAEVATIEPENFVDFLSFGLADRQYAIEIGRVRHVQRHPTVTRVPRSPSVIGGVTAVDGELAVAADLAVILRGEESSVTGSDRALVILEQDVTPDTVGLLVQTVDGIDRRAIEDVAPVEGVTPVGGEAGSDNADSDATGSGDVDSDATGSDRTGSDEEDEGTAARWFRAVLEPARTDEDPVPVLDVTGIVAEVTARC